MLDKAKLTANPAILIVEDENIVAKDLENRLKGLGYTVNAIVPSGEEAIERAANLQSDLVLMDIKLKGKVDGIVAAKQIRTLFNIPVIFITAYADEETLERAKATMPYGYILKPFEDRELRANIETALYKHEVEIRESEEKYRDLFENANDLIQIVDKDAKFLDVNKKWHEVLGYSKEEVKKITLWDILRPDQIPHCQEAFQKVLSGQNIERVETVFVSKSGKETFVEGTVSAKFKNNQFVSTRGIFRDISTRKIIEKQLQDKIVELEKFNRVAVGRELKMVELKNKIAELETQLKEKNTTALPT